MIHTNVELLRLTSIFIVLLECIDLAEPSEEALDGILRILFRLYSLS